MHFLNIIRFAALIAVVLIAGAQRLPTSLDRTVRDFGAACNGTTDDSPAMAAAATALRDTGAAVHIPANCRILMGGAAQVWMRGMSFVGDGNRDMSATPATHGSSILITATAASPFVVSDSWGMEGLEFYWPNQPLLASGGSPVVYPPMIALHGTDGAQGWTFANNVVVNAYDLLNMAAAGGGHFHIENNQIFALHYGFVFQSVGGESWIRDNQFSPVAWYASILGGSPSLTFTWALLNTEAIHVTGNGTGSVNSTPGIDGLRVSGNYFFLLNSAFHVFGGRVDIARFDGNAYDGIPNPILVDHGGSLEASFASEQIGQSSTAAPSYTGCAINVDPSAAPNNGISLSGVDFLGSSGNAVCMTDVGNAHLSIVGGSMWNVGGATGAPATPAVYLNTPNGTASIVGVQMRNTVSTNVAPAITVQSALSVAVAGNTLNGWLAGLNALNSIGGTYAGNSLVNRQTGYTAAVIGAGASSVAQAGNTP